MRVGVLSACAVGTLLLGCYPDFQFGQGGSGAGDTSSSRAATMDDGPITTSGGGYGNGGMAQHTTTSSQGGVQGNGGDATTGPVTSTSTGTGPAPVTVPCGNGQNVIVECMEAQVCCFGSDDSSLDHCEATNDCGSQYYMFSCNEQADCATGICCALVDDIVGDFLGVIQCQSTCDDPNRRMCASASECMPGEVCTQLFTNTFAPEYAPVYKYCNTP